MGAISSASSIKYGDYEIIKTTKETSEKIKSDLGLVDLGTKKDNVLDLTNPDKVMSELTQDKVQFIKVSEGLYVKLNLNNPAETNKLLADLKSSISKEKNLNQDFSPLVLKRPLACKPLPDRCFFSRPRRKPPLISTMKLLWQTHVLMILNIIPMKLINLIIRLQAIPNISWKTRKPEQVILIKISENSVKILIHF